MIEKVSGEEIKNEELDNELEQEGTPGEQTENHDSIDETPIQTAKKIQLLRKKAFLRRKKTPEMRR